MSSDSTGVEPPSPRLSPESPPSSQKPSLLQKLKLKQKQSPPIAFNTQARRRNHRRSSSFSELLSRILPSHREEKGYTIRKQLDPNDDSDPVELVFGTSDPAVAFRYGVAVDTGRGAPIQKTRSWSPRRSIHDDPGNGGWDAGPIHTDGNIVIGEQTAASTGMLKTQQMFEDKKARREQRRSLRESGDFLGVQGANPRTGYWDVSSGTNSSEPSQMSEETKRKLDEEAKVVDIQKQRYEEAKAKHEVELVRVQTLRDKKKKEKEKRKKIEMKMKQRRHGKWELSEEGWHSLAEPELSPITQSVAGSPGKETAPGDRLFPMPTADDPTPYINPTNIGPQDYFGHRLVSSPLAKERLSAQSGSLDARRSTSIPRKPIGSPTRRKNDESSNTIIHTNSQTDSVRNEHHTEETSHNIVRGGSYADAAVRGEVELGGSQQQMAGVKNEVPRVDVTLDTSPLAKSFLGSVSASQKFNYFLDRTLDPWSTANLLGNEATAILSRSASTSQAETLPLLDQNPKSTSPGKLYNSLKEFPPVILRDPFAARIPLSSRAMVSTIWAPPTILSSPRRMTPCIITIPTTTTTGSARLQPLQIQFDNQIDDISDVRRPSLQRKSSRTPLRTSSLPKDKQPAQQSTEPQADPADIATSSERLLGPTKQRTADSCHTISPEGEKVVVETTPISISMSHPTHEMVSPAARIVFLSPFQNLRHRVAMKKAEAQEREGSLTPPKLRRPTVEAGNIPPNVKGGKEEPFTARLGSYDAYRRGMHAINAATAWNGLREDSLMVVHPPPNAENRRASPVTGHPAVITPGSSPQSASHSPCRKAAFEESYAHASPYAGSRASSVPPRRKLTSDEKYGIVRYENGSSSLVVGGSWSPKAIRNAAGHGGWMQPTAEDTKAGKKGASSSSSSGKRAPPRSLASRGGTSMQQISAIAWTLTHWAWSFVEPVFDPQSDVRRRCDSGNLTLGDLVLFAAAAGFVTAALLVTVLAFRVIIMGLQIVRGFWTVCRILTSL